MFGTVLTDGLCDHLVKDFGKDFAFGGGDGASGEGFEGPRGRVGTEGVVVGGGGGVSGHYYFEEGGCGAGGGGVGGEEVWLFWLSGGDAKDGAGEIESFCESVYSVYSGWT